MHLLTGPPGSGKTYFALESLRSALHRRDGMVRLLVPTATMAEHLRNRMAREGFVFRPDVIQTLSRFIESCVSDRPQVSAAGFYLLVEGALRRLKRPEFLNVAHLPGFHAKLARALDECSAAGLDAPAFEKLPANSFGPALLSI